MREFGVLLAGGTFAAGIVFAGVLTAEVLSVRDRQCQRMTAGLCKEKLRMGRTTRAHQIHEFLL